MNMETQQEKARTFLSLHQKSEPLILPNIWNPIGAKVLETKGYPAVATASAAVSSSLGYADGERIKRTTLIDIITRIATSVRIPVTADIESGFANSISTLEETIHQVISSGVVGINIEDSVEQEGTLRSIEEQCERISAIRNFSTKEGLHLVINARVDTFLSNAFPTIEEKIEDSVIRARAYTDAGADCIYPIGPGDEATLRALRNQITSPLNILASANAVPLKKMKEIGINRVSFGPYIFRSCLRKFLDIAEELLMLGSYECFGETMMSRDETKMFLTEQAEQ